MTRRNLLAALATLTALPLSAAEPVACRVETERALVKAGERQTTVIQVTLEAPRPPADRKRPPVNLGIVLDRSGSMSGKKIEKARQAAIEAVKRLSADDVFSLVVYDDQIQTVVPAARVGNVDDIVRRIEQIRDGGNTALFGGVSQGASELRKHLDEKYVHRLILLSDGLANVGPSSPDELARLGASLKKEAISVTTVGVGEDYNEDLMNQLAARSDGNTYFVAEPADLARIFTAELGDVLSTVAKDVTVEIRFQDGVRPRRILGREGRIDGAKVDLHLNQLYGGQTKYILVEAEVDAAENGTRREVAQATVRYRNLIRDAEETAEGRASLGYSSDEAAVEKSVNASVGKEVALNAAAERREEAVKAWEAGRKDEAKQILRGNVSYLRAASSTYSAPELAAPAAADEADWQRLENEGLSKTARKSILTRSAQDKNQQDAR